MTLTEDVWTASQLGKPVHRLDVSQGALLSSKEIQRVLIGRGEIGLIYCKLQPDDIATIHCLEESGFRLVDTSITLERSISPVFQNAKGIRLARDEDRYDVCELARTSFIFSRFHMDPNIPNVVANSLKAEWATNYFKGKRGDMMIVAELNDRIVGFLQLIYKDEALIIDLVAVDRAARRQGYAAGMIALAQSHFRKCKNIRVGTQAVNLPSLRLYERLEFRIINVHYIFHYHAPHALTKRTINAHF